MRKTETLWCALFLATTLCWGAEPGRFEETAKTPAEAQEQPPNAYRMDFSMNELEDSKRINSRRYSMNLNAGDANQIKIGTRVPIEYKQGEFQYLDVGTTIFCRLKERGGDVSLEVRSEVSNFATADQGPGPHPALRQFTINGSTVAVVGRPIIIGSVDDPNSKRQFQLEVTVSKLK
jgi:hypothetical protein